MAGQAQRERIGLYGELDMRSRLFQIAKKLKNNEDSVAKKKKKTRQSRIDDLSMN